MQLIGHPRPFTGRPRPISLALVAGAVACAVAAPLNAQTLRYRVTDLGTIPGSTVCPCFFGIALSNQGHVVGRFFGANGRYHGFLWHGGATPVMIDLGSLGGGVTQVKDVNDSGVAAGLSQPDAETSHAFTFEGGVMTDLGTLGGRYSHGSAINNAGAVAGDAETRGRDGLQRATLWINGDATDLGTLGGEYSAALGINTPGHVVGWAWNEARRHRAFLWTPQSGMIDLGDLGGLTSIASAINDADQVVGSAPLDASTGIAHAFLWYQGVMIDLGVLPEAGQQEGPFGPELVNTAAGGINCVGQIVGNSYPGTPEPPLRPGPFIWQDGVMTNLNDLIDPSSRWTITEANDINDLGQIAGTAISGAGAIRAVLLSPAACRADFNASGAVDSQDFFDFVAAFFTGSPAADFNTDGSVNSQDFFDFVGEFFAGCE